MPAPTAIRRVVLGRRAAREERSIAAPRPRAARTAPPADVGARRHPVPAPTAGSTG